MVLLIRAGRGGPDQLMGQDVRSLVVAGWSLLSVDFMIYGSWSGELVFAANLKYALAL